MFPLSGEAVTGIFTRWRQFGMRYFWPHLLLGMVAASFGLPVPGSTGHATPSEAAARNSERDSSIRFDSAALLQESNRRTSFSVDYWHQHAIRTVIRHLSFALTPQLLPGAEALSPLQEQRIALIDTLNALLTQHQTPALITLQPNAFFRTCILVYCVKHWLGRVQGIRAGPLRVS